MLHLLLLYQSGMRIIIDKEIMKIKEIVDANTIIVIVVIKALLQLTQKEHQLMY